MLAVNCENKNVRLQLMLVEHTKQKEIDVDRGKRDGKLKMLIQTNGDMSRHIAQLVSARTVPILGFTVLVEAETNARFAKKLKGTTGRISVTIEEHGRRWPAATFSPRNALHAINATLTKCGLQ